MTTALAVFPPAGQSARAAAAAQPVGPGGQRTETVGAPLGHRAWIIRAHGVGQGGEPVGHRVPVGGVDGGHDLGQPVAHVADQDLAFGEAILADPDRVAVGAGDDLVDAGGELVAVEHPPAGGLHGQLRVHAGAQVVVGDQPGAKHRGPKRGLVDVAGHEHPPQHRQLDPQGVGVAHVAGGQSAADAQRH